MKKRYTGAMQGQGGLFQPIRKAWATRFARIRAFIMIPEASEKIELSMHYDTRMGEDCLIVTRTNYATGKTQTLFSERLQELQPDQGRFKKH